MFDEAADGVAFAEFYKRYYPKLMRHLWYFGVKNTCDREDLVQETMLLAQSHWDDKSWREHPAMESAWLWTTARRLAIRQAQSPSSSEISLDVEAASEYLSAADLTGDYDTLDALREGIRLLPTELADVLIARADGYTMAQSGKILGVSESSIRWRLRKGRQLLHLYYQSKP